MKNRILSRRDLLRLGSMSMAAGLILPACVPTATRTVGDTDTTNIGGTTTGTTTSGGSCSLIPSETAGPYPAHDDTAINCLTLTGIERSDIRSSLNTGGYTGTATATGLPLTLRLRIVDVSSGCTALSGHAVYVWHCDVNGKYSMYSSGITNQTYLRGVQETDADGWVTFTTVFPGCYDGRMTHIHFEVYPSIAQAISDNYVLRTSQLSFPLTVSSSVYSNNSAYATSVTNLSRISFATDNVFSDGTSNQIASIESGSALTGYTASLVVGI